MLFTGLGRSILGKTVPSGPAALGRTRDLCYIWQSLITSGMQHIKLCSVLYSSTLEKEKADSSWITVILFLFGY